MAADPYAATQEMTNKLRVARLLMCPCTDQLRDILRYHVPPDKFNSVIQKKKSQLSHLTKPQRQLIFPDSGAYTGDYNDMDISILYILLRNICGIKEHRNGWGKDPDSADRSVSANIERLRLARNSCGHSNLDMSNDKFNQVWSDISASVVDLDNFLGTKYQDSVKFIQTDTMDPMMEKKYLEQLQEQIKEFENLNEKINSHQSEKMLSSMHFKL